jgi:hypothetical protein
MEFSGLSEIIAPYISALYFSVGKTITEKCRTETHEIRPAQRIKRPIEIECWRACLTSIRSSVDFRMRRR